MFHTKTNCLKYSGNNIEEYNNRCERKRSNDKEEGAYKHHNNIELYNIPDMGYFFVSWINDISEKWHLSENE